MFSREEQRGNLQAGEANASQHKVSELTHEQLHAVSYTAGSPLLVGGRMKMNRRSSLDRAQCTDVGDTAVRHVQAFSRRSSFCDAEKVRAVRQFRMDEIFVGRLLGTGSFSDVYEASIRTTKQSSARRLSDGDTNSGGTSCSDDELIRGAKTPDGSIHRYALKYIKPVIMDDADEFTAAAVDLAIEARMLSSLDHPNIIKLAGVAAGSISDAFSSGIEGGYFLVLDRVECTLGDRIEAWADEERCSKFSQVGMGKMLRRQSNKSKIAPSLPSSSQLHRRLLLAVGVARGLEYLHTKNIVYRDLKPANIGINSFGEIKIFDFVLATEIAVDNDSRKKLTGMSGTLRYMSPEVATFKHYGVSADVYSFAILLWEICSLEKPFAKFNIRDMSDKVAYGGQRPELKRSWPQRVKCLMVAGWSAEEPFRPTMRCIADRLEETVTGLSSLTPKTGKTMTDKDTDDNEKEQKSSASVLKKIAFPVRKLQRRRSYFC